MSPIVGLLMVAAFNLKFFGSDFLVVALGSELNEFTAAPESMLVLFDEECPQGWVEFNRSQGQLLISTGYADRDFVSTDDLGIPRIKGEEKPVHSHDYERKMCATRALFRFNDGQNTNLVNSEHWCNAVDKMNCDDNPNSSFAATGLDYPFAQLRACKSPQSLTVPVGTVAYFDDKNMQACPPGWSSFSESEGRFLRAKDTVLHQFAGSVVSASTPLDTRFVEDRQHRHGAEAQQTFGTKTKRNYGYYASYPNGGSGGDTITFTGLSDLSGLNLPFSHMLTCKATRGEIGSHVERNPPSGTLMFYDDAENNSCDSRWAEASQMWASKLIVMVPQAEGPKVWSSAALADATLSQSHSHSTNYRVGLDYNTNRNWAYLGASGGNFEYIDNALQYSGTAQSSSSYSPTWTPCPTSGLCNVGGGKVLARFGAFVGSEGPSTSTNSGKNKYNYIEADGSFECSQEAFFGDPTVDSFPTSCDFAPIVDEPIPTLDIRLCQSTGFVSKSPSASPTEAPAVPTIASPSFVPTFAPIKSGCSADDRTNWFENGGREVFDAQVRNCASSCSVLPGEEVSAKMGECLELCLTDTSETRGCAICKRVWLECLAVQCVECDNGNGVAGRSNSDACASCSRFSCDTPFQLCSKQSMTIGNFILDNPQDQDLEGQGETSELNMAIIAGAASGSAVLLAIGALLFIMKRTDSSHFINAVTKPIQVKEKGEAGAARAAETGNLQSNPAAVRLKAEFDFEAENEDELSVSVGDALIGIQQEGDWWFVESFTSSEVGLVPAAYIRKIL